MYSGPPTLVVHGHFYQPPRENPWTEEVAREPSAAPFHDWNARITAECYRPNGAARIVDDAGRIVAIADNYRLISFDVGPTLLSWLERHAPDVYERILQADAAAHGGMAQAFGHMILPLANSRDIRTQIRWGLADFEHRFGRRAEGMWLPEAAVNEEVLAVLVEEGVRFTLLAPGQAAEPVDVGTVYRWVHPDGRGELAIVFYDGDLSHDMAFSLGTLAAQEFVHRVGDGMVTVATDGETFGHHHRWGERFLAYTLAEEAPRRAVRVANLATVVREAEPTAEVAVRESSWSCAHGVARWREDCGCSTGAEPGWNQAWRTPLREALDLLRDRAVEVFERRGPAVLRDPWAARDDYVRVLIGATTKVDFAAAHVTGDPVEAFGLLEAQRHAMAMYTSCGWFFNDLAGLETVQVLRYAARLIDLLVEVGEPAPEHGFLDVLAKAESNRPEEGNGRDVWRRHVLPARVDAGRVVAHLALMELLERRSPSSRAGAYEVEVVDHDHADGGPTADGADGGPTADGADGGPQADYAERDSLALCTGYVRLTHTRTGRRTEHVYAALHLGGLEVLGATRHADPRLDADAPALLRQAFDHGAPVTTLLRMVSAGFGPHEFGLDAALPDAAEEILQGAARALADRFTGAYEQLFADHRGKLAALAAAGYELPPELRAPAELSLARRFEAEVAAQAGSTDPAAYAGAVAIARQARSEGYRIDTPEARHSLERIVTDAVEQGDTDVALALLSLARDLDLPLDLDRAQEVAYERLHAGEADESWRALATALHLALPST
jgi:alpha-amylase/alpha-mannosidase (GH57 family)